MTDPARFIPPVSDGGATLFGNSFLSSWVNCRREWFNLNLRPRDYLQVRSDHPAMVRSNRLETFF